MQSGLESVRLPPTLRVLEEDTFSQCEELRDVTFPNGLESIGRFSFFQTSLENIEFPTSLRTVAQGAFAECTRLKAVKFNEGLEVLGTDEHSNDGTMFYGVF